MIEAHLTSHLHFSIAFICLQLVYQGARGKTGVSLLALKYPIV